MGWFVCLLCGLPFMLIGPALGLIDLRGGQLRPSRETSALADCGENNDRIGETGRHSPPPSPARVHTQVGTRPPRRPGGARLKLQGWTDRLGHPWGRWEGVWRSPWPSPSHQLGGYQYQLRGDSAGGICLHQKRQGEHIEEWLNSPPEADFLSVPEVSQAGQLCPASR